MDEELQKTLQAQLKKMGFAAPEPETTPAIEVPQKTEEKDEVSTEDMDGGSF